MIIQRTVCDPCHGAGVATDSVATRTITIDKQTMELDVCQNHDDALSEALVPFFAAARRVAGPKRVKPPKPTEPATPDGPPVFACICGREFNTARGLTRHTNFPPQGESIQDHDVAA